jgi:cytochrome c2
MRRFTWLALAAVLPVVGVAARTGMPQQDDSVLLSVDLPDREAVGATVFERKGCGRCHTIAGVGRGKSGPDLGRTVFAGNALDLAGALWNHAPTIRQSMRDDSISRPTLTPEEAADIVAFLTAYRYYDTQVREAGNPALGRGVFVKKGCAGCHEAAAGQAAVGPDLRKFRGRYAPIAFTQALWNHAPAMTAAMQARGVPVPAFSGREMTDLTAYLQVGVEAKGPDPVVFEPGSPRRGRDLFAGKGCAKCHTVGASVNQGAPDLGTKGRALARSVPEIAGVMWNHSQGMSAEFAQRGIARPTFSGQEMADVTAYLFFINYANVRATPSRGQAVFNRRCSVCHTLGEKKVGPDLLAAPGLDRPIGIIAAMWNHAGAMEKETSQRKVPWPRLERGETADLTAFLIVRRQTRPAAEPPLRTARRTGS